MRTQALAVGLSSPDIPVPGDPGRIVHRELRPEHAVVTPVPEGPVTAVATGLVPTMGVRAIAAPHHTG